MTYFNQKMITSLLMDKEYKSQMVSTSHLKEIQDEIEGLKDRIYPNIYEHYLKFDYDLGAVDFDAKSIIIIGMKSKITKVEFNIDSRKIKTVIPPTYITSKKDRNQITELFSDITKKHGFHFKRCYLPQKLLSVRSGLSEYGRNNISYINGMGSFYRLETFFTDIPVDDEVWQDIKIMDRCSSCTICADKCKTGSIEKDGTLIDASKCITYYNEIEGEFPEWINSKWHNAIIGCMDCQMECPENKNYIESNDEIVVFSDEETQMITDDTEFDSLKASTKEKLKTISVVGYYTTFVRNLKALIS